ncbi:TonB-dependent receptor [Acetobacter sacchari]|uniref:TonB-dependent receptor n=1 Tax=Acetobacter sacchari TaxID=2661687 RepID=A0ABS3LX97_9PROT|nr:TonB-dependent receptor [Acetobacter sacchari]MBO1360520.1 TonB-dependent receptor [Acetobacter sacchari]
MIKHTTCLTGCVAVSAILAIALAGAAGAATRAHHRGSSGASAAASSAISPRNGGAAAAVPVKRAPTVFNAAGTEAVAAVGHRHVSGGGMMRAETAAKAVSTVTHEYISKQSPASNALALIQMAPGANVAMGDPFGVSDESMITVRGMNQQQIGYTFEGAPMNDPDDYTPNSSEWIDSENMDNVQLQQGSGELNSPLTNSAGGIMAVNMRNPKYEHGGELDVSYGTHQLNRQFIRYDTGEIGHSGVRAFASYSNLSGKAWRGPGRNNRRHMDFKAIKEWGNSFISVAGSYNNENTAYYPTYDSVSQWNQEGLSHNFSGTYNVNDASYNGLNSYYKFYQTNWADILISAPMHFEASPKLTFDVSPYVYHGSGAYPFGAGSLSNGAGDYGGLLAINGSNYNGTGTTGASIATGNAATYSTAQGEAINAMYNWLGTEGYAGLNSSVKYKTKHNELTFGWWFGYTDMQALEPFSALTATGQAANFDGRYNLKLTDGTLLSEQSYHTITMTNMLYIGDQVTLLNDRLHISAGFKEAMISRDGTFGQPVEGYYKVGYNTAEPLPRMSIDYHVNPNVMVFASVNTNFRTPVGTAMYNAYDNPWNGSQITTGNTKLKNEYSIVEEVGARYSGSLGNASITGFNYNFTNHQVNAYNGANPLPVAMNVGGMTIRGVDAQMGLRPWHHFSPYASGEYLYATTDNNIPDDTGGYLNTKGKIAPSAPRWQASVALNYDDGTMFGSVTLRYVDKQYSTYTNDEQIKGYKQVDMMIGARMKKIGFMKSPSIRLNIINLADHHYLSGVYSPGTTAGTAQLLAAPNFACLATFSTGF